MERGALIRPASPATFSRKREKGERAPSPAKGVLLERPSLDGLCGRGPG